MTWGSTPRLRSLGLRGLETDLSVPRVWAQTRTQLPPPRRSPLRDRMGGQRSWWGLPSPQDRRDPLGAPPILGRGRGVRRGRPVPRPAEKGPASCPRFRFRSDPRPSRTLTDSRLQSLRLHLGLHPPRAPGLGTAPHSPPLSRDLLGTTLRRLKGQRPPRRAGAAHTNAWHHRDANELV